MNRVRRMLVAAATAAAAATSAIAQEPTFTFTKPEDRPNGAPVWTARAQLGLSAATGNSEALGASASASASRRAAQTRLSAEARGAFSRSQIRIATESNGIPGIGPDEIDTIARTTTEAWELRGRVDRYLGERNSIYASAGAGGDRPAGRRLVAGGQAGYARALVLTAVHELTLELGYDVSHEDFVGAAEPVTSQSARAFLGYQVKPAPIVALRLSVDVLANLAPEDLPARRVSALDHQRVLGRAELDVKVNSRGSVGLRMRARYDSAPGPRPAFSDQPYEAGFVPLAERLDTATELVFVYALL